MKKFCNVCGAPCKKSCPKCHKSLCYIHAPRTKRGSCAECRMQMRARSAAAAIQQIPSYAAAVATQTSSSAARHVNVAPTPPTTKPLKDMTQTEISHELDHLRDALRAKHASDEKYVKYKKKQGSLSPSVAQIDSDLSVLVRAIELIDLVIDEFS